MILHITTLAAWTEAQRTGTDVAPSLEAEGFIHCSTPAQLTATADVYYRGVANLVVLCIEERRVAAEVRWEPPSHDSDSRGDERFPHLYGPLDLDAVVAVLDLSARPDGSFEAPEGLDALMR